MDEGLPSFFHRFTLSLIMSFRQFKMPDALPHYALEFLKNSHQPTPYRSRTIVHRQRYARPREEHRGPTGYFAEKLPRNCLLYTSPSPRDGLLSRMPSSA